MDRPRDEVPGIENLAPKDVGVDRPMAATIQDVIAARLGRRELLRGLAAAATAVAWPAVRPEQAAAQASGGSTLTFTEVPHGLDDRHHVVLTNNDRRKPKDDANPRDRADAANRRPANRWGHVIELIPPGGAGLAADHTADTYRWEIFLLAGDPGKPEQGAKYGPGVSSNGWLAAPDNIAFDARGRVWIGTDGMPTQAQPPAADALYAADTADPFGRSPAASSLPPGARRSAAPCSHRTAGRSSWRSSTRPRSGAPPSTSRRRAGRTSRRACRRVRPSS